MVHEQDNQDLIEDDDILDNVPEEAVVGKAPPPVEDTRGQAPVEPGEDGLSVDPLISFELRRLIESFPVPRADDYSDILQVKQKELGFKPVYGGSPFRPRVELSPKDPTTPFWEAWHHGRHNQSLAGYRRGLGRAWQSDFSQETTIENYNDFWNKLGPSMPQFILVREAKGEYSHYVTQEQTMRAIMENMAYEDHENKSRNGSKYARMLADTEGFLQEAFLLEAATAPLPGVGIGATIARGIGKTSGIFSKRLATELLKPVSESVVVRGAVWGREGIRSSARLASNKVSTTASKFYRRKAAVRSIKNNPNIPFTSRSPGISLPTEIGTSLGDYGARQLVSVHSAAAVLGSSMKFGGALFIDQVGDTLMTGEEMTYGDMALTVAVDLALGSIIGGMHAWYAHSILKGASKASLRLADEVKWIEEPLTAREAGRTKGSLAKSRRELRDHVKKWGKLIPPKMIDKAKRLKLIEEGLANPELSLWGRIDANVLSVVANIPQYLKDRIQGSFQVLFGKSGFSPNLARIFAAFPRALFGGAMMFGIAYFTGGKASQSSVSNEGIQDLIRTGMVKALQSAADGEDAPVIASEGATGAMGAIIEGLNIGMRSAYNEVNDLSVEDKTRLSEAVDAFFGYINNELMEWYKEYHEVVTETGISALAPWQGQLENSAMEINQSPLPSASHRKLASAYREKSMETVTGDTVGEMWDEFDSSVAIVTDDDAIQELQVMLGERYFDIVKDIDQSFINGAMDDNGLFFVGNMTVRVIASGLAQLLDAKANDRLAEEAAEMKDDSRWLFDAAGPAVFDLAEKTTKLAALGVDYIGKHLNFDDEDLLTHQNIMHGYNEGARERFAIGVSTDEDQDVAFYTNLSNVINLLSSYQDVLYAKIPGMRQLAPSPAERARALASTGPVVPQPDNQFGESALFPRRPDAPDDVSGPAAGPPQPSQDAFAEAPTDIPEFDTELADASEIVGDLSI